MKALRILPLALLATCLTNLPSLSAETKTLGTAKITATSVNGIGREKSVMRRDPSDVIKVGDLYYVWYSKGPIKTGYNATVWYATSRDGLDWDEQGMALPKGEQGAWDAGSVFTPNILVAEGRDASFFRT